MKNPQKIFESAYALMNEPIIDGNCGLLCNYHCCRSHDHQSKLGMYLIPFEFEMMQKTQSIDYEVHSSYKYDLPTGLKKMYYIYCSDDSDCLRNFRPIQCRTYPFEPHIREGVLSLVIEKDQLHYCPLLNQMENWRPEFIKGIYEGWSLLITLDRIKKYVESISNEREMQNNIQTELSYEDILRRDD